MTTLADFLLARIAEDEAVARLAQQVASGPMVPAVESRAVVFDAPRVLAECEAKVRIVEDYAEMLVKDVAYRKRHGHTQLMYGIARVLASVYSDHPDFDEEWRL